MLIGESMKNRILNAVKRLKENDGMTLIEIMIVITIIAIMGAIVVPNLMDMPKKAKAQAAKESINNLKLALQNYSLNNGNYPATDEGLEALTRDGLLKQKDTIDPWGNPYQYISPGEHDADYDLWSYGADGKDGGEGFDADVTSWE
jgi:general secretion pathway protein G